MDGKTAAQRSLWLSWGGTALGTKGAGILSIPLPHLRRLDEETEAPRGCGFHRAGSSVTRQGWRCGGGKRGVVLWACALSPDTGGGVGCKDPADWLMMAMRGRHAGLLHLQMSSPVVSPLGCGSVLSCSRILSTLSVKGCTVSPQTSGEVVRPRMSALLRTDSWRPSQWRPAVDIQAQWGGTGWGC